MQRNRKPASRSLLFLPLALAVAVGCGSEEGAPPANIGAEGQDAASSAQDSFSSAPTEHIEIRARKAQNRTPAPLDIDIEDTRGFSEIRIETALGGTRLGDIHVRLNAEKAPLTVDNFLLNYVDQGFYDNTIFHYVDKESMVIAGGYSSDLQQKETRDGIPSEADNGLRNLRGTIAMARYPEEPDSATCQFFINLADNAKLDYKNSDGPKDKGYCVFGKVTRGMDVVESIAEVAVEDRNQFPKTPSKQVSILSIKRVR